MTDHSDRPVPQPGPLKGTEPLNGRTRLKLLRLTIRHTDRCTAVIVLGLLLTWTASYALLLWTLDIPTTAGELALGSAAMLAAFVLIGFPLGQALMIARWRRHEGWVVGYFDATATLLVHPEDGAWVLSDHAAEHRGRGLARPFRRKVFAHLAAEADGLGVPIVVATTVRALADLYVADLPHLKVSGQAIRGRCGRMRYLALRTSGGGEARRVRFGG